MGIPLSVDVVSDLICPWCFVGKRRLDIAAQDQADLEVQYRPFRLDPDLPAEGMDRGQYIRAKFGDDERAPTIEQALMETGEEIGIKFAFETISRTPNTLDCHRLIQWAGSAGVQDIVVEDLFRRYFEQGVDISVHEVLADIGSGAGMDRDLLIELLAGDDDKDFIIQEDDLARRMGIQGVPCYIIAGRYALMGAQDPDVLRQAFDQVRQAQRAGAEGPAA
jgi:predicted DsbA family dithiol-disulfide isomerase